MHVLVTGGSGFVGSHVVAALQRDGHRVRVLARTPARARDAVAAAGGDPDAVEVVEGDLEEASTVAPALEDVEAVVHAASVYSFDPRDAGTMTRVNLEGMTAVVDRAVELGLDPVVHVSSLVALLPPRAAEIGPDSPVGDPDPVVAPYAASKAAQERRARALQEQGAPVVSVLPGAVWGPNDPHDGESTRLARSIARRQLVFSVRGGMMAVDVRDVADVVGAVVRQGPGRGPRRYTAGGTWRSVSELHHDIGTVLGRRLPTVATPPAMAAGLARGAGWLQRRVRVRLPIGTEPVFVSRSFVPSDDSRTREELDVTFRPFRQTLREQLDWQQAAGRL